MKVAKSKKFWALTAALIASPSIASATDVSNSHVSFQTNAVRNWESGHWGTAQAGSSAYVCGDVGGGSGLYVYYAIVRDIQALPDREEVKRGSYEYDPTLCSSRISIVNGNSYYTRAFTNQESPSQSGWAVARK